MIGSSTFSANKFIRTITTTTRIAPHNPDVAKAKEVTDRLGLVDESDEGEKKKKIDEQLKKFIPDGYEENYIKAYRRCQDRPGGEMILR